LQPVREQPIRHQVVATPIPPALSPVVEHEVGQGLVLPIVGALSLFAHGVVLAAIALLPMPTSAISPSVDELAFEIAPAREEPEVAPEPEVVAPEPQPVAAQPVRRVVREREQPAAPPPLLTALGSEASGPTDFVVPPGDPDGAVGGREGGVGAGSIAAPAPVEPAAAPAISRDALRQMLVGYVRDTLGGFLNGRIDYPIAARREHQQGVVMLRIRLSRDGRILAVRLSRSSGHDALDRAAVASVEGLGSMPAPPRTIPWDDERELPLPVTYQLMQ
jgi:protein TonB